MMLQSGGASQATLSAKRVALNAFEKFRASNTERLAKYPAPFHDLPESVVAHPDIYAAFGYYLLHEHKSDQGKNAGNLLSCGTILDYLFSLLNQGKARYGAVGQDSSRLFFTCLDKNSQSSHAQWLQGIKRNIVRETFERAKRSGEQIDKSEPPIYLSHITAVVRTLSLHKAQSEAAHRKLSLTSLWQAAGRAAEVAWLSYSGMCWDEFFQCVLQQVPQPKTSKVKIVAFVAGSTRHSCWFLAWADQLVLGPRSLYDADNESLPLWVLPNLQHTHAGATLGKFLQNLLPVSRRGSKDYGDVDTLPDGVSAGSIRPGAVNMLAAYMPAELAVPVTGHDLRELSAFYEYLDATPALAMPGATVLAGWQAFPWGKLGLGPRPASLQPLSSISVKQEDLNDITDRLFRLDTSAPPTLHRQGALRPAVERALATLMMYYQPRFDEGEMRSVTIALQDAVASVHCSGNLVQAHTTLLRWGELIQQQWKLDNLHLTVPRHIPGPGVTGRIDPETGGGALGQLLTTLVDTVSELSREVTKLRGVVAELNERDREVECREPKIKKPRMKTDGATDDSASTESGLDVKPEVKPEPPVSTKACWNAMFPPGATPAAGTLGKLTAADIFLRVAKNNGIAQLPGLGHQDVGRAKEVYNWLIAMASENEIARLKDRAVDDGTKAKIAAKLSGLTRDWLAAEFEKHGEKILALGRDKLLKGSAIETRRKQLKAKHGVVIVEPDRTVFMKFRRDCEEKKAAEREAIAHAYKGQLEGKKRARE